MSLQCPACFTELDPTNTHCPVCLRPRSRAEMMKGLQETRLPPRRRWLKILAALLVVGGGAAAFVANRAPAPAPPPAPVAAPEPAPAPAPEPAPPPTLAPAHAPAPEAPPVPKIEPTPKKKPKYRLVREEDDASQGRPYWRVSGEVYDLMSLKPIDGVKVVFQDKSTGEAVSAVTDKLGRYKLALPKIHEGGYDITVAKRGYSGAWLEEMTPAYKRQSRERRLEALEQLSGSEVLHVPLLPEYTERSLVYDVVLFPRQ